MKVFFWYIVLILNVLYFEGECSSDQSCDSLGVHFYDEIGCKAQYKRGQQCPTSYDCPKRKYDPKHCRFLGVDYNIGEAINHTSYCNVGCFCDAADEKYICAEVDCYFGPEEKPECYRIYTLRKCCSADKQCPPFDNVATCKVDGKVYKEGEIFPARNKCLNCVCQKGFKGELKEPFCIKRPCDVELIFSKEIENKCTPVYGINNWYGDNALCCPSGFVCPDESTSVEITKSGKDSAKKCRFGKYELSVGDSFETLYKYGSRNVTCKCNVPPLPSCSYIY